ncbi:MAG: AbrB/MazE/SpoVT family DNA-binding domain-containing protein [Gallionellaceae bacterium]|nr:AbrB/MazE/SpoVT family DNA-binding domain-containing protein [Gallionellaceae bacterium]
MEAKLVRIGNSKGIRLPKAMLTQTGMTERIEIEARGHNIILKPIKEPRSGWEASFAKGIRKLSKEDRAWLDADLGAIDRVSGKGDSW